MADAHPEQVDIREPLAGDAPSKSHLKKLAKEQQKELRKVERQKAALAAQQPAVAPESVPANNFYGTLPLNQSQSRESQAYTPISSLSSALEGQHVVFRARLTTARCQAKRAFLNLRQRNHSVQGLLVRNDSSVNEQMVEWTSTLSEESILRVEGVVQGVPTPVKSTSVSDVEVLIQKLHLVSPVHGRLPFSLDDASRPESGLEKEESQETQMNRVLLDTRLNHRVLDLRTQTNQAVFKLQSAISGLFRTFLEGHNFIEIHSPKLQGTATESGASVFKVEYFKGRAYLAQSPQLAKQMAIAADFERVYEIGPVFRAEDSNTHRHMTEFIGVDLEMAIEEHYHEVVELIDEMFKSVFRGLKQKYRKEIDIIGKQFPAEEFKWRDGPEGTLKLTFKEATDLLVADGVPAEDLDDISTENERRLGRLVKAKYDTDYFYIDKYPAALRPFYTMPDPADPTLSNSYDFFMRGEEILSGGQRVHDPALLCERMRQKGVDPESMKGYVDGFKMGCVPHGGAGVGLERVLMLFLKLNNIRRASLFPRDPKRLEP